MATEIKNGKIFSKGIEVVGVESDSNRSLSDFIKNYRQEIESYGESKTGDNILTFLIMKGVIVGIKSEVDKFTQEWKERGVSIAL